MLVVVSSCQNKIGNLTVSESDSDLGKLVVYLQTRLKTLHSGVISITLLSSSSLDDEFVSARFYVNEYESSGTGTNTNRKTLQIPQKRYQVRVFIVTTHELAHETSSEFRGVTEATTTATTGILSLDETTGIVYSLFFASYLV